MTTTKMTRTEALAEAQRRWGTSGEVNTLTEPRSMREVGDSPLSLYEVGILEGGGGDWDVRGSGDSWEAAFADADRKEAR